MIHPDVHRMALPTAVAAVLVIAATAPQPAAALDARALSLGGSAIAKGHGVHGVLDNPATLKRQQRDGQGLHLHSGFAVDARDSGGIVDTLTDDGNDDLADDIEAEIDRLTGAQVNCIPGVDSDDTVCLEGTGELGRLSGEILDILDDVDGEMIEAQGTADFGMAMTSTPIPFAVHLRVAGTLAGEPSVADDDRTYIGDFENLLSDGNLTIGDLDASNSLNVNNGDVDNGVPPTLDIVQPEDALTSDVDGSALIRVQLGVSFAETFDVGQHAVDVGVTPKISRLTGSNLNTSIADQFDDDSDSLQDQFDDSENSETSFTLDLGAAMDVPGMPLRVAGVIRNLIPESLKTENGFEFETTPQLIIGSVYTMGQLSFNADLALNSAEVDNFESQPLSLGIEYGTSMFQIRGGIAHDPGRDDDTTALSLGFGAGPFHLGARVADQDSAQVSAQLSFSF